MNIWTLRIKNRYLLMSMGMLFLLVFIFFIMDDLNVIRTFLFGWKPEPEFSSAKQYIYEVYHYDLFVNAGTKLFQIILPILAIVPSIHFKEEVRHFFQHKFLRKNCYKREVIFSVLGNALLVALAFYVAYVLALLVGYTIFPVNELGSNFRDMFDNILGTTFAQNNVLLYYILTGGIRIFLPTFFYSLLSLSILIYISKKYVYLFIPVIYHFVMMITIPIIHLIIENQTISNIFIYFAPQILLAPNGLSYPQMSLIMMGYIPYILICVILISARLLQKERVGTNE